MYKVSQQLRHANGWVARNTKVWVWLPDGVTPALVFDGNDQPLPFPLSTDEEGMLRFYVHALNPLFYTMEQGFVTTLPAPLDIGLVFTVENRSNVSIEGPAGENITAGQPVSRSAIGAFVKASSSTAGMEAIGLAATSALLGENVKVVTEGELFLPGNIHPVNSLLFLGDGEITPVLPSLPNAIFHQPLGRVLTSTKILVGIYPSIYLS